MDYFRPIAMTDPARPEGAPATPPVIGVMPLVESVDIA